MRKSATIYFLVAISLVVLSACGKNAPAGYGGYYPVAPAPNGQYPYYQYPNGMGGGAGYGGYNGYPYPGYGGTGYSGYPGSYGNYSGPNGSPYGYNFPNSGGYPVYFYPQIPSSQGQNYFPFVPVDNYFRNNPDYGQTYWTNIWNGWLRHALSIGAQPTDFEKFWKVYCPKVWKSGKEQQIFIYLDNTFYFWNQPGVEIPVQTNPGQFWVHYIGIIY